MNELDTGGNRRDRNFCLESARMLSQIQYDFPPMNEDDHSTAKHLLFLA
jgi:hypothetical protein